MDNSAEKSKNKKSIFRSLFVPLFVILVMQAVVFYFAAVYGGMEESLTQNAADILSERLINRKNEIETQFINKWTNLDECSESLVELYSDYESQYGARFFNEDKLKQIEYLSSASSVLIDTLRHNEVNGVFLILNDSDAPSTPAQGAVEQKYGLCIRDMDQESNYNKTEDLLLERSPSALIDSLKCSLDSWWEALYSLEYGKNSDYYYTPLYAAYDYNKTKGTNLAYLSGAYRLSGSDPEMIAYSIPLIDKDGHPFGVLGIELSVKYLNSLLPNKELGDADHCCYVLAIEEQDSNALTPICATGALYTRLFESKADISLNVKNSTGGFTLTGRGGIKLYGTTADFKIYSKNNPFSGRELNLAAIVESKTLFSYISKVKTTLMIVSVISALTGIIGLWIVSRRFAAPITALARRVQSTKDKTDVTLTRLGITEIDQLVDSIEQLNQSVNKNSARTEFFSRMSHDMRTPMNAIISFSSPEFNDGANEEAKDSNLDKIHTSGLYLLELINEVLDIAKIESNKIDLRSQEYSCTRLFSSTLTIIEELANTKGVHFTKSINAAEHMYIYADSQHLNQIVINLLSNAVKFTPEGGNVSFSLEVKEKETDPGLADVLIIISDTGIGMSREFIQKLYTPFEQENGAHEGTGLGLSIAKKLIDLMGGTIECESVKNRGTTFTIDFSFPIKQGHSDGKEENSHTDKIEATEQTISEQSDLETATKELYGKTLLVCEDNVINTEIICHLLEKTGMSVITAKNGSEGIAAFEASEVNCFDAVLMDIRMPVMDGIEATKRIRKLNRPDATTVPIIAMTANAFIEDVENCLDAGMNEHLSKPVEPKKLFLVLSQHINERSKLE